MEEGTTCILCKDIATHTKMGKALCDYHYELSIDHKRGR